MAALLRETPERLNRIPMGIEETGLPPDLDLREPGALRHRLVASVFARQSAAAERKEWDEAEPVPFQRWQHALFNTTLRQTIFLLGRHEAGGFIALGRSDCVSDIDGGCIRRPNAANLPLLDQAIESAKSLID